MVPPGLQNLAPGSSITCSDKNVPADNLAKLTDGDKEASDQSIIFLRKGTQWVQMDLGSPQEIFAMVIWHAHNMAKVYHDVIVQVADDPDFTGNVRTVFNNDSDNSSGLGFGTNREYFETYEGKLINAKGVKARFVRFYSKGSTESALNEYTEIEVYGRRSDHRDCRPPLSRPPAVCVRRPRPRTASPSCWRLVSVSCRMVALWRCS